MAIQRWKNMSNLRITDNHDFVSLNRDPDSRYWHDPIDDVVKKDLRLISNEKIEKLTLETNPNLLVFPKDLHHYGDKISESYIISLRNDEISTGNIMGFVGVNNTQLDIKSRFAKVDGEDFFLHYMLQKVFSINLFDIKHSTTKKPIFDFLLYLFPYFLKKALAQGLFKKYQRYEYNDANIKGPINVSRHIRENIPFKGTVAYSTREHSYDNDITQLIRHTIECIKTKELGVSVLNNDKETKECVTQITMATQTYNLRERFQVINRNLRPIRHPYYSAYSELQKLCLQILRHESIKYGQDKDKVYGVLFDGAWLWEEYLNTVLKTVGFKHPENKKHKGGLRMFVNDSDDETIGKNSRRLYPDFYKEGICPNDRFILDAKYKHLDSGVGREDLYQVVTYMYCSEANNGAYVYPCDHALPTEKYQLKGYGGCISIIPFHIPQPQNDIEWNWSSFSGIINKSELSLKQAILEL